MNDDHHHIDKALGLRPIAEAKMEMDGDSTDEELAPEVVEDTCVDMVSKDEPPVEAVEGSSKTLPAVVDGSPASAVTVAPGEDETLDDLEKARGNIRNIITKGDSSLDEMIELAKQSESPRAFEVAAGLMKTLLEANKDFVEVSMKKKYHRESLEGPKEAAQTNVVNNNLILSTKDLLEMLKNGD